MSVIVCTYSSDREALLFDTIDSLRAQERPPDQLIVVVDHNPRLYERLHDSLSDVTVVENASPERGISGARSTGLQRAAGSIIAFVDDDATARSDWLRNLLGHFLDPAVIVAGSRVEPRWAAEPPRWFPIEFGWVMGCSYQGQLEGDTADVVRNVYANGMAARRVVLQAGEFQPRLGRVGSIPLGCEETEWCIRVSRRFPASKIILTPTAVLDHYVPVERATFRRFVEHCFAEGVSKAAVAAFVGPSSALASERRFVWRTLRTGILRRLVRSSVGDAAALLQAGAIGVGLTSTTLGYLLGRLRGTTLKLVARPSSP